jgi:hypothetical protein
MTRQHAYKLHCKANKWPRTGLINRWRNRIELRNWLILYSKTKQTILFWLITKNSWLKIINKQLKTVLLLKWCSELLTQVSKMAKIQAVFMIRKLNTTLIRLLLDQINSWRVRISTHICKYLLISCRLMKLNFAVRQWQLIAWLVVQT